jgi:hypothetical protein
VTALAIAAACATRAQAQSADSTGAAASADTGWVEIGGASPFGEDDPFADLPESTATSEKEEQGRLFPYFAFNRVDAWTVGLDETFRPKRGWLPGFSIRMARAFGRTTAPDEHGEWLYDLRVEQPILPNRAATLELAQYRFTKDDEFGQIGHLENTIDALFFKYDWRDWFTTEGWSATLRGSWRLHWSGGASYIDRDDEAVVSPGQGAQSLFRREQDWRENPPADEGDLKAVRLFAAYDSRTQGTKPRRGMWHRIETETAGGSLGGDFAYIRYLADLRAYLAPAPSHYFKTRVMAGTTSEGDFLPFQRTFAVGGVGTLRATPFRQFRGRHLVLWNADWAWEVFRRSSKNAALKTGLSLVVWNDVGIAWDAPQWDLGHQKPAWNAGLGIGTTDETLRVYFGRDLRAEHAPVHVTVRIAQSY